MCKCFGSCDQSQIAKDWLSEVRKGGDPGAAEAAARVALNLAQLCSKFIEDYSKVRNKPRTVKSCREALGGF